MKRKKEKYNSIFTRDSRFYEPVYTPAVVANKLHLSTHTLRLYEAEGLIIPCRTSTGRRLYSDVELEKIKSIHDMIKIHGNNFEGIRRLLALVPCWKIRDCSKEELDGCTKNNTREKPCWATEEKCCKPLIPCRSCPVYTRLITYKDINGFINS